MNDRFMIALKRVLNALLPDFDLYAIHPARVLRSANGKVDLRPDNAKLPDLTEVPIRTITPNSSVVFTKDSKVLIAFEDGNRNKPFVLGAAGGDFSELTFGSKNTQAVARVTDQVEVTIPIGSVLIASPTPPGFAPNPAPITLKGTIKTGSSKVKSE